MAQHDYDIANQSFPAFRTDVNNVLSAINSSNSGSSRPSSAVAGTIWLDTSGAATAQLLKMYDGAADITLATVNFTANTVDFTDSSVTIADDSVTLAKMASGTDGNIISYDASGNPVAVATGNDGQVLTSTGAGSPPVFETLPTGGLDGVTTGSGNVTITDGNLIVASGHGIDFSATGNISGTSTELLNDYETGTWTPVFRDTSSTGTIQNQDGAPKAFYTKIGRLVQCSFQVRKESGQSLSGAMFCTGLPFQTNTPNASTINGGYWIDNSSGDGNGFLISDDNTTYCYFKPANAPDTQVSTDFWVNGRYIYAQLIYSTD
jgi:hypothetical protein